jgi:hypothetical protein
MSVSLFSDASDAGDHRGFCIYIDTLCQGPTQRFAMKTDCLVSSKPRTKRIVRSSIRS